MKKLAINPSNKKYYSDDYIKGWEDGVDAQYEATKDAIEVVRCKDCRHAKECHKSVHYTRNEPNTVTIGYLPIEWCSRGERREE